MYFWQLKPGDRIFYDCFKGAQFLIIKTIEQTKTHFLIEAGRKTFKVPKKLELETKYETNSFVLISYLGTVKWYLENKKSITNEVIKKLKTQECKQFLKTNQNEKVYELKKEEETKQLKLNVEKDNWVVGRRCVENYSKSYLIKNCWEDYRCGYIMVIVGFKNLCSLNKNNTSKDKEFLLIKRDKQIIKERYMRRF